MANSQDTSGSSPDNLDPIAGTLIPTQDEKVPVTVGVYSADAGRVAIEVTDKLVLLLDSDQALDLAFRAVESVLQMRQASRDQEEQ
jgi:hypothetical protein